MGGPFPAKPTHSPPNEPGFRVSTSVDLDFVPNILSISQKMLKFAAANEPGGIYGIIYIWIDRESERASAFDIG